MYFLKISMFPKDPIYWVSKIRVFDRFRKLFRLICRKELLTLQEGVKEMDVKGKKRFKWELEKFVVMRLNPVLEFFYTDGNIEHKEVFSSSESRIQFMDSFCESNQYRYRNKWKELADFSQLTNQQICQKMFCNAFTGRSKMYIQIQDLRFDEGEIFYRPDKIVDGNRIKWKDENKVITLQCSLLTLQMLDYDIMMFRAMSDAEDEEYKKAAQQYYRPYLFSYVVEINQEKYIKLKDLQKNLVGLERTSSDEGDEPSPYVWLACTFNPDIRASYVDFEGYVVQSANRINKIRADIYIIEDEKTPIATVNSILEGYSLNSSCLKDDGSFIRSMEEKLCHNPLSTIDVYKIGNGNCVFAQEAGSDVSFFYDIGFNYRHRPQKIVPGATYSYVATMKEVYAKNPSFFILSHWDMDHVAGVAAARKNFFDKVWFAPDCYDACTDAKRLAIYLDLKNNLLLAKRRPKKGTWPGRLIGQINITSATVPSQTLAVYKLYMGKKDQCDSSYPNCEGIVIEYLDTIKERKVLMMGDVNYASFNKARSTNRDTLFADTQIDYLIVPHHGSEHTAYEQITDSDRITIKGAMAIICCTNECVYNRPNDSHREELEKRFDDNVYTTEEALPKNNSIKIIL